MAQVEEDVTYDWLHLMNRPGLAACRRAYESYVRGCLGEADDALGAVYQSSLYAIGDEAFVRGVEDEIRQAAAGRRTRSDLTRPPERRYDLVEVLRNACEVLGVKEKDLRDKGRRMGTKRAMAIELVCRAGSITQRALAEYLGVSEHAVGKQRSRLASAWAADVAQRKCFETAVRRLDTMSRSDTEFA